MKPALIEEIIAAVFHATGKTEQAPVVQQRSSSSSLRAPTVDVNRKAAPRYREDFWGIALEAGMPIKQMCFEGEPELWNRELQTLSESWNAEKTEAF